MAKGPSYRVAFRRRREGKTDYQQRRNLVLSGLPRMVIRGSLRSMSIQLIKAEVNGDKVIVSAHSKELAKKYGWQGGEGNLSAAYLTGLLCGYKAAASGVKEAVLDLGLHAPTKGSRVFAALRGVLDAGLTIPHSADKLPDEKRVQGLHVAEYAKQLSSTPESYQKRFAEQLSRGLRPEEITEHFSKVKQKFSSALQKIEAPEKREEEGEKPPKEEVEKKKKPRRRVVTAEKPVKAKVKRRKKPEKMEEKK
jgi:large subunit ribosomal protein L18